MTTCFTAKKVGEGAPQQCDVGTVGAVRLGAGFLFVNDLIKLAAAQSRESL